MARILVGLSGGVDSSVAAALLVEQGHDVVGAYMKNWVNDEGIPGECPWEQDIQDALAVAKTTGIEFRVIDLVDEYRARIVNYLIEGYRAGYTPNPDVLCNREMKFGVFLDYALEQGFDYVATGHYARRMDTPQGAFILRGRDPNKDQSYFLSLMRPDQIARAVFPLGDLLKPEVRVLAEKYGLPTARKKDSQGICFLGKINYNDFIRRFLGERPGPVVELETGKVIGQHRGYWFHTIGQRKGLGLGGGPWFVVDKNVEDNIIYVSHGYDTEKQFGHSFCVKDFHFITLNPWKEQETEICFKIRHTDTFQTGKVCFAEDGTLQVSSEEPIQGIAPGQFGVIYDKDARLCIGSGEIRAKIY